jgi:hypothetical protein
VTPSCASPSPTAAVAAGGATVAMRVSGATVATRYFHTDNLGSISVNTNETGAVVERDG